MGSVQSLLNSVQCGTCRTFLTQQYDLNGILVFKCKCLLKIRALLTCVKCKKQFLNPPYLIRKANYCSLNCYWTGTDRKQLRICKACGREFYATTSLINKGYGFYCSKDCWFDLFERLKKKVKCKQCKKEFLVIRAVYNKHPKFCSKTCKDISEIDQISSVCRGCKISFNLPRSAIDRGRGLFCNWKCYKKYKGESSLELLVRQQLEKLDEPFQQEVRFGKFRADFYLPKRNLIIECDGEYWHMNQKIELRDKRKDKFLERLGYNILRLTGQQIINNTFILKNLLLIK